MLIKTLQVRFIRQMSDTSTVTLHICRMDLGHRHGNSSIPSLDSSETSNPYANLDTSNLSDLSFSAAHTSTPKRQHPTKEPQIRSKKG